EARLLLRARPAQVAPRSVRSAQAAADQTVALELGADESRIDVRLVLEGDFDRLEAPPAEVGKQRGACVGEGRGEQKRVDPESHAASRIAAILNHGRRDGILFRYHEVRACPKSRLCLSFEEPEHADFLAR